MRCKPFVSAASELVPETEHPLEQLTLLEEKAKSLKREGDLDAVIECRIKQLSLHKVLSLLYGFPSRQEMIQAEIGLAEAYAEAGYGRQADDHLARAREACEGGVHDDAEMKRLQVDLLTAEGVIYVAQERYDLAAPTLADASRAARETVGEYSAPAARVHLLLGQVAMAESRPADALDHLLAAREAQEELSMSTEEAARLGLHLAEAAHASGREEEALREQQDAIQMLQREALLPALQVEGLSQLARWTESRGREFDEEALKHLKEAEQVVEASLGKEDPKAVEVKRDVALLHLKLGQHDIALQYLQTVEYLERRLHGSQSANVARTLKALGTVHLVQGHFPEAERCLCQALRIFEADYQPNAAIIRDIHAKLSSIASAPQN